MKLMLELAEKEKEGRVYASQNNILSLLNAFIGTVPDHVQQIITSETDLDKLNEYLLATRATSYEDFLDKIGKEKPPKEDHL